MTSDSTFGNLSEETQNTNLEEHKHFFVHCNVIYNCYDMKAAQVSISRWVDEKDVVHLHNGILLSHKKKEILPCVAEWMDLENIMLSEISQSEKDKYRITSLKCGI